MRLFGWFRSQRLAERIAVRVAGVVTYVLQGMFREILHTLHKEGANAVTAYTDAKNILTKLSADIQTLKDNEAKRTADAVAAAVAGVTADFGNQLAGKDTEIATKDAEIASLNAEIADLGADATAIDTTVAPPATADVVVPPPVAPQADAPSAPDQA